MYSGEVWWGEEGRGGVLLKISDHTGEALIILVFSCVPHRFTTLLQLGV